MYIFRLFVNLTNTGAIKRSLNVRIQIYLYLFCTISVYYTELSNLLNLADIFKYEINVKFLGYNVARLSSIIRILLLPP
ncbi:hypothetical protein PUN28_015459 [Cardiocondyla obscurior]|uniref:Uncharacterized protein n=1 Tax=Cardiocondyla obscurior TaxID=286306 RepID=A0AAW2EY75_9HYME